MRRVLRLIPSIGRGLQLVALGLLHDDLQHGLLHCGEHHVIDQPRLRAGQVLEVLLEVPGHCLVDRRWSCHCRVSPMSLQVSSTRSRSEKNRSIRSSCVCGASLVVDASRAAPPSRRRRQAFEQPVLLHAAQVPADVLARGAHADELAVERVVVEQVLAQQAPDLVPGRRRQLAAGAEVVVDLAEDPRPPLRGAADHDRIGAGARAAPRAPFPANRCRRWRRPEGRRSP